jgi:hypothetical protein
MSDMQICPFRFISSNTRSSQKVPRMVIFDCIRRTCGKRVQWLGDDRNVFLGEELLHNKRCVVLCPIVMQNPLSLPLVTPLPQNCIAQPLKNFHVEMTSNTVQTVRTHGAPNRLCQRMQRAPLFSRNFLTTHHNARKVVLFGGGILN